MSERALASMYLVKSSNTEVRPLPPLKTLDRGYGSKVSTPNRGPRLADN